MATSGTTTFDLDLADIIEEAYERCGLELRDGYTLTSARRSIELLLTEWANHQVNIWKVDELNLALVASTREYTIVDPVLDILGGVIRDVNNIDIPMNRISFQEYLTYPDKETEGRPTNFAVVRERNQLRVFFWNQPDIAYTFVYWGLNYIEDAGATYTNNVDIPRRFLPSLIAGLAFKIAQKHPTSTSIDPATGKFSESGGVSAQVRAELKADYDQLFQLAREEDRDRAPFIVRPRIRRP